MVFSSFCCLGNPNAPLHNFGALAFHLSAKQSKQRMIASFLSPPLFEFIIYHSLMSDAHALAFWHVVRRPDWRGSCVRKVVQLYSSWWGVVRLAVKRNKRTKKRKHTPEHKQIYTHANGRRKAQKCGENTDHCFCCCGCHLSSSARLPNPHFNHNDQPTTLPATAPAHLKPKQTDAVRYK